MDDETEKIIYFFNLANGLKKNRRTGWVERGVPDAESIADHSFRMSLMALILSKENGVNSERAVKMALVHDLPEAITGDIPRTRIDHYENLLGIKPDISEEEKLAGERKAMKALCSKLGKSAAGEIFSLWKEFEERKTKASRFVKELDSLELLLQAVEYKRAQPENKTLWDFFDYTIRKKRISSAIGKKIEKKLIADYKKIEKK